MQEEERRMRVEEMGHTFLSPFIRSPGLVPTHCRHAQYQYDFYSQVPVRFGSDIGTVVFSSP